MLDLLREIPAGYTHLVEEDVYCPWGEIVETWKGPVFFTVHVFRCALSKKIKYILLDD